MPPSNTPGSPRCSHVVVQTLVQSRVQPCSSLTRELASKAENSSVEEDHGLPLDALLSPQCDLETSSFVEAVLRSGSPALRNLAVTLGQLPKSQLEKAISSALSSSSRGLDFVYALRSACAALASSQAKPASPRLATGGAPPSASVIAQPAQLRPDVAVDHACAALLRPLHAPQLLHCTQLSLRPEHAELLRQARESETVQRAASEEAFAAKFGPGRQVHALVHAGAPDTLLAILYSAILPRLPSSVREVDRHSGFARAAVAGADAEADAPSTGQWSLSQEAVGAMQPPRSAIAFYSVSTPHPATRGLQLGRRIIYSVAAATAAACPSIRTFATLSPIPGFTQWLRASPQVVGALLAHGAHSGDGAHRAHGPSSVSLHAAAAAAAAGEHGSHHEDAAAVIQAASLLLGPEHRDVDCSDSAGGRGGDGPQAHSHAHPHTATAARAASALLAVLAHPGWYSNAAVRELLRKPLLRLCQHYLLLHGRGGGALCHVAAFHLSNGAAMGRILWAADESADGIARSAGLMVNYVYSTDGLEGLHATMTEGAPAYARSPSEVLATQKPEIVDSQEADAAHGEA